MDEQQEEQTPSETTSSSIGPTEEEYSPSSSPLMMTSDDDDDSAIVNSSESGNGESNLKAQGDEHDDDEAISDLPTDTADKAAASENVELVSETPIDDAEKMETAKRNSPPPPPPPPEPDISNKQEQELNEKEEKEEQAPVSQVTDSSQQQEQEKSQCSSSIMSESTKPDPPSILDNLAEEDNDDDDDVEDTDLLPRGSDCPTITTNGSNHSKHGIVDGDVLQAALQVSYIDVPSSPSSDGSAAALLLRDTVDVRVPSVQRQLSNLSTSSNRKRPSDVSNNDHQSVRVIEEKNERDFVNREVIFSSQSDPPSSSSNQNQGKHHVLPTRKEQYVLPREEQYDEVNFIQSPLSNEDDGATNQEDGVAAFAAAAAAAATPPIGTTLTRKTALAPVNESADPVNKSSTTIPEESALTTIEPANSRSPPPPPSPSSSSMKQAEQSPSPSRKQANYTTGSSPPQLKSALQLQQQPQQFPPVPSPVQAQSQQQLHQYAASSPALQQQLQPHPYHHGPSPQQPQQLLMPTSQSFGEINNSNVSSNGPLLSPAPGFASPNLPPAPQQRPTLVHQSSFGAAPGNMIMGQPQQQNPYIVQQQQQQPQRRKIKLRLEEDVEIKQQQQQQRKKRSSFLGHIRTSSRRMMFGAEQESSSSASASALGPIAEKAGQEGADGGFTTIPRGSITISWFEGTSSLELHEHVRKSIYRKLHLNPTNIQLLDMRLLDESVNPPEEIILSPFLPNGSIFLLRFSTRDTTNDGTASPGSTYSYPQSQRGPPDSPSAAPSPHPARGQNQGGLDSKQLAQLAQQLDHLRQQRPDGGRGGGLSTSVANKLGLLSSLRTQTVSGTGAKEGENGAGNNKQTTSDLSKKGPSGDNAGAEEEEIESDESDMMLHSEDPIEARLRQITELLISDRQKSRGSTASSRRRHDRRQTVFVLANYFVLFLSLIAISAEIQARAPGWLNSMEAQMKNVQDCAANQEALFECVSRGDVAGLIASVILWLSRSVATRRIFLFGFETPLKLWIVVYESFVTAFCWGVSYIFIRRGLNPDTRRNFLQRYWKDAVYGSLAGFNAAFMKQVLKNLIPQEAVEDAFKERPLKILNWLPSFE